MSAIASNDAVIDRLIEFNRLAMRDPKTLDDPLRRDVAGGSICPIFVS